MSSVPSTKRPITPGRTDALMYRWLVSDQTVGLSTPDLVSRPANRRCIHEAESHPRTAVSRTDTRIAKRPSIPARPNSWVQARNTMPPIST